MIARDGRRPRDWPGPGASGPEPPLPAPAWVGAGPPSLPPPLPLPLPPLAVVIPTLNEAAHLPLLLAQLAAMPALVGEVLVVDGGSSDGTGTIARLAGARLMANSGGRGAQLALGACQTTAPWLDCPSPPWGSV